MSENIFDMKLFFFCGGEEMKHDTELIPYILHLLLLLVFLGTNRAVYRDAVFFSANNFSDVDGVPVILDSLYVSFTVR